MELLLVGTGGILGSLLRFTLGKWISKKMQTGFPWHTFFINITGAILLGSITCINPERNFLLFAADGFLGAYTTFSTFMYEGFSLYSDSKKFNACVYIVSSVVFGIAGYFLGFLATNSLV
jgi:fluoride exporter